MGVSYREFIKTQRKKNKKALSAGKAKPVWGQRTETRATIRSKYRAKSYKGHRADNPTQERLI